MKLKKFFRNWNFGKILETTVGSLIVKFSSAPVNTFTNLRLQVRDYRLLSANPWVQIREWKSPSACPRVQIGRSRSVCSRMIIEFCLILQVKYIKFIKLCKICTAVHNDHNFNLQCWKYGANFINKKVMKILDQPFYSNISPYNSVIADFCLWWPKVCEISNTLWCMPVSLSVYSEKK